MHHPFMIGNKAIESHEKIKVINPYSGETMGIVSCADSVHIEEAIQKANIACSFGRRLKNHQKAEILRSISDQIRSSAEDLALTICQEVAKPIRDARNEVERAAITFGIAASITETQEGTLHTLDIHPSSTERIGLSRRFPIGVVLAITPFNFPLNLVAHKVAPALAVGNPVILKPSSKAPVTALKLGRIMSDCGLPDGMFSVLPAQSSEIQRIFTDPRLSMISFTGSPDVGWNLKRIAHKKKVALELGGNAGVIVDENANVDYAAKRCCIGAFSFSGQICISVQRIFVHSSIYDEFKVKLVAHASAMLLGDPSQSNVDMGPLIDIESAIRVDQWIEEAINAGSRLVCGGCRTDNFIKPTILERVPHTCKVYRDEVFGPLVTLEPFDSFDDALECINDSRFGLQAGIFTRDFNRIWKSFTELDVGGVVIDDIPTVRVDNYPYGGIKESGCGREGVKYAMEEMSELRMLLLKGCMSG